MFRSARKLWIIFIIVLQPLALAGNKSGSPKGLPKPQTATQDTTKKQQRIKLFLDQIEVKGWIEKPQTIFVVPGVNPEVDDIVLDRSFSNEILRPLDKDKFEKQKVRRKKLVIPW